MSPTLIAGLTILASLIAGSTVFFHIVEGWGWLDSYFFTVVTLSTVGYGDMVPQTAPGKIATTGLIFAGIGTFAFVIQQVAAQTIKRRENHSGWVSRQLRPHQADPNTTNKESDEDKT